MTLLSTILGFVLLSWGLRRLTRAGRAPAGVSPHPTTPSAPTRPTRAEGELSALQARYVGGEIEVEELESRVADALEHPSAPPAAPVYTQRTEIHVYDQPAGAALHIHL